MSQSPASPLAAANCTLRTELRRYSGRPRLFINGEAHPGIFCSVQPAQMRNFIDAGFDIFDTHPLTPHGWVGEDQYDYTQTDARIESYLRQKPDALLILRFWMEYDQAHPRPWHGLWWQDQHPQERVVSSRGPDSGHLKNEPSFASLKWRAAAGEALRRVIAHVEQKYGDRVAAYVPGGGPCGEWFHWFCYGAHFGRDRLDDYSEPMRRAFCAALAQQYGTITALDAAWGTDLACFEQAALPTADQRNQGRRGSLRDECLDRQVIDFMEAYNRQTADTLVHFAQMAKLGCNRRKVVMAFYGYLWHHQANMVAQSRSGHLHLDQILSCPDIDYVISPFHYSFRQMGGVISGQAPVATARLHGKQFVHELDGSTNLKSSWPSPIDNIPQDAAQTGELQRRDLARVITQGVSAWYMDLDPGMYDHPAVVAELRTTLEIARKHALQAGPGNHEVAVVLSPCDTHYYREDEPLLTPLVAMFKQFHLERMGLGYDDLLLEDLERLSPEETRQYRFWVFPSLVHVTDGQLELLRRHCFRNGNHVLFNYGVGVCAGEGLNLERMRQITGFDCECTMVPGEVAVRLAGKPHPLLTGLPLDTTYGTYGELSPATIRHHAALKNYPERFEIAPRFFIRGGGVILGNTLDYGSGPMGGLAVADRGDWVSVLSVAPLLPRQILRNIAAAAGCHVYTDFTGQVFHCEGYFGMYFHESGQCRVRLTRPSRVTDVVSGHLVASSVRELSIDAKANTTVLYRIESC